MARGGNDEYLSTKFCYRTLAAVKTYSRSGLKGVEAVIVRRYFPKQGRVLDLGCGTGRTSRELARRGLKVFAVDYSPEMIMAARRRPEKGVRFMVMDAAKLSFSDNYFEACLFSFNGLDYLYPEEMRMSALREIFRVLKPGGVFAFSSHNALTLPDNFWRISKTLRSFLEGKIAPYRWDYQPFGKLITHYICPHAQVGQLARVGFGNTRVVSRFGGNLWKITFCDPYPSYVACKLLLC